MNKSLNMIDLLNTKIQTKLTSNDKYNNIQDISLNLDGDLKVLYNGSLLSGTYRDFSKSVECLSNDICEFVFNSLKEKPQQNTKSNMKLSHLMILASSLGVQL